MFDLFKKQKLRTRRYHLLWPLLAVIGLIVCVHQALVSIPQDRVFQENGIATDAEIIELFEVDLGPLNKHRNRQNKRVRLEFAVDNGAVQTIVEPVDDTFFSERKTGETVRITYLGNDPSIYRVDTGFKLNRTLMFYLYLLFTLGMIAMTIITWRKRALRKE